MVGADPPTERLPYRVESSPEPGQAEGKRLLLHICCGPCSTYPIERLREEGFEVTGFWYNPNIHPFSEHERRRKSAEEYAQKVGLPMIWWPEYQVVEFLRRVAGHEAKGERCPLDYEMRLRRTAEVAAQKGYEAMTTTLLISPYQDQAQIREIGERVAREHGVEFHFENFRRGWSERGRLTREHGLYRQNYCGCLYSEWERLHRRGEVEP